MGSETIDFSAGVLRNPGVGSAVIRYSLPASGPVRIAIWDVTGRMVGRPVERVESSGTHAFTFDPRGRGTQLYFYRVEWQGATRTGRFTILE